MKIVLSLFDGMSCGQIALKELGVNVAKYYASEIDKFAIAQTMLNFPNTIQLGSVIDVDVSKLDKIDLLIGGSPCQSFSFAGKRKGMSTKTSEEIYTLDRYLELKKQGFEFEGQSYLFWEYMRVLTDIRKINPDVVFLLENVEMGNKWERILSEAIGVFGVHINSALLSAQNRKRIYWTNISTKSVGLFGELHVDIPQPRDKGILLKDILKSDVDEKYFLSDKMIKFFISNYRKMKERGNGFKIESTDGNKKAKTVTTLCGNRMDDDFILIPEATESGYIEIKPGECFDFENPKSKTRRGRKMEQKSNCLMAKKTDFMHFTDNLRIRRLTPTECARLQTIPSWYVWECSETQQYRMLGNGWTVDVICYILKYLLI